MGVCEMTVKRTRLVLLDLHSRLRRSCNPITQSRAFHCHFAHTHAFSLLSHTHIMYKRNWDDPCLFDLIYFVLHIFIFEICVANDAVAMLLPLWLHAAALWRNAVWIRIVRSHYAWMSYECSLQNLNRPRAIHKHNPGPSKQWSVCDNTSITATKTTTATATATTTTTW